MDWKVITINVFYVQLLKVDFCSNDDKSVPNMLLCFSASIQMVLFFNLLLFGKLPDFHEIFFFFIYAQTMYWHSSSKNNFGP